MNWIYELPFGHGKPLLGNAHGVLDRIVGGWSLNGTGRVQSGSPFSMGNVRLVGMTRSELQSAVGMRFNDGAKIAYFLPQDIIDNTIRAFNTSATSRQRLRIAGRADAVATSHRPAPGCIEVYTGQCGGTSLILYGPHLTRFDISAVKKTRISERVNVELRAEFLNVFNNINFLVGNPNNDTNTATNFTSGVRTGDQRLQRSVDHLRSGRPPDSVRGADQLLSRSGAATPRRAVPPRPFQISFPYPPS